MARNLEKQEAMTIRIIVLIIILSVLSASAKAADEAHPPSPELRLVYSANVNGELKGCG